MIKKIILSLLITGLFSCSVNTIFGQTKKRYTNKIQSSTDNKKKIVASKNNKGYKIKIGKSRPAKMYYKDCTVKDVYNFYKKSIIKKLPDPINHQAQNILISDRFSRDAIANQFGNVIDVLPLSEKDSFKLIFNPASNDEPNPFFKIDFVTNTTVITLYSEANKQAENNSEFQSKYINSLLKFINEHPELNIPMVKIKEVGKASHSASLVIGKTITTIQGNSSGWKATLNTNYYDTTSLITDTLTNKFITEYTITNKQNIKENTVCGCGNFNSDSIKKYATESCYGCTDENTLIYDAKCKKFWQIRQNKVIEIEDIKKVRLYFGRAFKVKLIRFNRYLNNISVGNSDIAFSSSEPALMQQYLFPANGTNTITYNSYANGSSNNDGGHFFDVIPSLRANVDKIFNLAETYTPNADFLITFKTFRDQYQSKQGLRNSINEEITHINSLIRVKNNLIDSNNIKITSIERSDKKQKNKLKSLKKYNEIPNIKSTYFEDDNIISDLFKIIQLIDSEMAISKNSKEINSSNLRDNYSNIDFQISKQYSNKNKNTKKIEKDNTVINEYKNYIGKQGEYSMELVSDEESIYNELRVLKDTIRRFFLSGNYAFLPIGRATEYRYINKFIENTPSLIIQMTKITADETRKYNHFDSLIKAKKNVDKDTLDKWTDYMRSDSISLKNLNQHYENAKAYSYYILDTLCKNFDTSLRHFSSFYDSLLDKKINAYSLCTNSFPCCKENTTYSYRYFDAMLQDINDKYLAFSRFVKDTNNLASKTLMAKAPKIDTIYKYDTVKIDAQGNKVHSAVVKTVPAIKTDTINITSSDLIINNNRITGLKLHQIPDTTTKAKSSPAATPTTAAAAATALVAIDTLWNNFEKISSADIMRIILVNNNMINENMAYSTVPIFPYGDRLALTLTLGPTDTLSKMDITPVGIDKISFDFPVYHKSLFCFSTGTFVGLGNAVKSPSYEWQQISANNTIPVGSPYRLVKNDPGASPLGFDALANVSWRVWSSLNFGFSGGVGVIVDAPVRLAYLLGGNISLGNYQRFHFTAGISGMQVNVLKSDFDTNIIYSTKPADVQYIRTIKAGGFLSVSYTIFSIQATGSQPTSGSSK